MTYLFFLTTLGRLGLDVDLAIPFLSGNNLGVQIELEPLLS